MMAFSRWGQGYLPPNGGYHIISTSTHTPLLIPFEHSQHQVKKDKKSLEDALKKSDNYRDAIDSEVSDYQTIDSAQRRAERNVEKQKARLQQIEEDGTDFPDMAAIDETIKQMKTELMRVKAAMRKEKEKLTRSAGEKEKAEIEKENAVGRLERLKDDKKLRLEAFCRKIPAVGKAYEYINGNRKEFRKKVWGPVGKSYVAFLSMASRQCCLRMTRPLISTAFHNSEKS